MLDEICFANGNFIDDVFLQILEVIPANAKRHRPYSQIRIDFALGQSSHRHDAIGLGDCPKIVGYLAKSTGQDIRRCDECHTQ